MLSLTSPFTSTSLAAVGALLLAVGFLVSWIGAAAWTARRNTRRRQNWLRSYVRRIDEAVIVTDGRGAITAMNGLAESMTGWTETESLGLPVGAVFRLVDVQTHRPVVNPVVKALYKGIIVGPSNDTLLVRKDGAERPVSDTAAPICDGRGRARGCALAFRALAA
jgi:PAS domain S-box-containing protein